MEVGRNLRQPFPRRGGGTGIAKLQSYYGKTRIDQWRIPNHLREILNRTLAWLNRWQ